MSKKKIISLCLVVCLLATAVGGTLAYFTDTDSEKNTFTVGKVDIEVSETNKINNVDVTGNAFKNVMPGTEITKTAVVTNNSSETAYVRVVVHLNNQLGLYNMLLDDSGDNLAVDMDEVMPGWNFNPEKSNKDADTGMRYIWDETDTTGVDVIAIDVAMANNESGKYLANAANYITNAAEQAANIGGRVQMDLTDACAYYDILYFDDLAWVFYLKMNAGASYTLFEGINPDASFGAEEMAFFDGLEINVCADAIQSTGFGTDAKAAFEALNEAHPLSAWELK